MKRIRRLKFVLLLTVVMVALPLLMAPVNSSEPIPVEVERIKDYYYFKIHGSPLPQAGFGVAEVIYKNLNDSKQWVAIYFEYTFNGDVLSETKNYEVPAGETIQYLRYGDQGTTVYFELSITPYPEQPAFSDTIIIPPPQ